MDGVMAHSDGRGQEAQVATLLVRRLEALVEAPTRGAVLARRDVGVLGAAEELAARIPQVMRAANWERILGGRFAVTEPPGLGKWQTATFRGGDRHWTTLSSASPSMPSPTFNTPIPP